MLTPFIYFIVSFSMCILASLLRETVTPFATVCAGVSFSSRVNDASSRATRCKAADKILVVFETSKVMFRGKHDLAEFGNVKEINRRCEMHYSKIMEYDDAL